MVATFCVKFSLQPLLGTRDEGAGVITQVGYFWEKKRKTPVRLETTEVMESMTTNRLTGEETM